MGRRKMTRQPDVEQREDWQIDQGKRCGCRGHDDWCSCQNNMPSADPRKMPDEIYAWPSGVTPGGAVALTGSWGARRYHTEEAVRYVREDGKR